MTRAIHARDQHCQYPGCDEPPGFGEIHHCLHWYKDHGPTSIEHGILLCWHHHDLIHARNITITRTRGRWHFHDQHGRPIEPTRRNELPQRE
ncbi:HNH endonuclease signature motif containing protein [Georgenia sp. Z1491]|uniref:HNH endonuclease signature motif containing protein n=1 Tax=Georgenia sp. Z1491 TaxID=3416707 RepID=UPI003CF0544A